MAADRKVDATRGLRSNIVAGTLAAAMLASSLGGAQAASFLEKNFWLSGPNYSGQVPACDTPAALGKIQKHFAQTESRFWNSSLTIDAFDRVREIAFRPWGEEYQPRRYCVADVYISGAAPSMSAYPAEWSGGKAGGVLAHGTRRQVFYSIIEDGGFLGFSWGVQWCVEGLDRSWTYAPDCRMAQP